MRDILAESRNFARFKKCEICSTLLFVTLLMLEHFQLPCFFNLNLQIVKKNMLKNHLKDLRINVPEILIQAGDVVQNCGLKWCNYIGPVIKFAGTNLIKKHTYSYFVIIPFWRFRADFNPPKQGSKSARNPPKRYNVIERRLKHK